MEQKPYDYDSNSNETGVSLLVQGTATAGLITAGLGFPSLYNTIKKNYPSAMLNSVTNKFIRNKKPSALELTFMMGKDVYETFSKAENLAKYYKDRVERNIIDKRAIDFSREHQREITEPLRLQQQETLEKRASIDNLISNKGSNVEKINVIEQGIVIGKSANIKTKHNISEGFFYSPLNQKNLAYLRKESIRTYIEAMGDNETLKLKNPTMYKMLESINNKNISDTTINEMFDSIIGQNNQTSNELTNIHVNTLTKIQGGKFSHKDATAGGLYRIKSVADIIHPKQVRETITFESDFTGFKPKKRKPILSIKSEYTDISNELDSKLDDLFKHRQLAHLNKQDVYGDTVLQLKKRIGEINKDLHGLYHTNGQYATIHLGVVDGGIELTIESPTQLTGKNLKRSTIIPVVDANGRYKIGKSMTSYVSQQVSLSGQSMPFNTMQNLAHNLPVNAIVKNLSYETDTHRISQLQKLMYGLIKGDLSSGSVVADHFKSRTVHRLDMPLLGDKKQVRMKLSNINESTLLKHAKQSGRNLLIYDTEFFLGESGSFGPTVAAKNPHLISPYQISYRIVGTDGKTISAGTRYMKDSNMDKVLSAHKSGVHNKEYYLFKQSLQVTGKIDQLDSILDTIAKNGEDTRTVLNDVFNGVGKDSIIVDFAGKGGSDRAWINHKYNGIFEGRHMMDAYKIFRGISSRTHNFALVDIFNDIAKNASDNEFNNILDNITTNSSSVAHDTLIKKLSDIRKNNPKLDKQTIIDAILADAHDSSVDVAMTQVVMNHSFKNNPLMGVNGTFSAHIQSILKLGHIDSKTKIKLLNQANLSANFIGSDQGTTAFYMSNLPNVATQSQLRSGKWAIGELHRLNPFTTENSGLKQIHQELYGNKLLSTDKDGRLLSPFVTAFRKELEHHGDKSIQRNIAINSEPVLMTAMVIPKGYGIAPDGSIFMDNQAMKHLYQRRTAKSGHITLKVDPSGKFDMRGIIAQKIEKIKAENTHLQVFKPDNVKEFNEKLMDLLNRENKEIADLLEQGQVSAGTIQGKYYNIKQNDLIAESIFDIKNKERKYTSIGNARISNLQMLMDKKGEITFNYELEELMKGEKALTPGGKGRIEYINNLNSVVKLAPSEYLDQIVKGGYKAKTLFESTLFGREEIGQSKQLMMNRIYLKYTITGDHVGARQFLEDLFGSSHSYMTENNQSRVTLNVGSSVKDALELSQGVSVDKMIRHMKKSKLTWDNQSTKFFAASLGIDIATEKLNASIFDDKVMQMWNAKNKEPNQLLKGANSTNVLNTHMKNNSELKFLRAVYNPYYDYLNDKVLTTSEGNAAFFDMMEGVDRTTGKKLYIPGLYTGVDINEQISYHIQQQKDVRKRSRATFLTDAQMEQASHLWKSSFEREALNRNIGSKRHQARASATRVLATMVGDTEARNRGPQAVIKANDTALDNIVRRTLVNSDLHKHIKDVGSIAGLDETAFNKLYKRYYANSYSKDLKQYRSEIKLLEDKIEITTDNIQKKEFTDQIKSIKKRIGDLQTTVRNNLTDKSTIPTKSDFQNSIGTFFENIQKDGYTSTATSNKIGDVKVAPFDLLFVKSVGYKPKTGKAFVDMLYEFEKRNSDRLGGDITKKAQRDYLRGIIELAEQNTKGNFGITGGVYLPDFQTVADVQNLDPISIQRGHGYKSNLTKKYGNVLQMLNEYENSKKADYNTNKLDMAIEEFYTSFTSALHSKKGLLNTTLDYESTGVYGVIHSPFAAKYNVDTMLDKHNVIKNKLIKQRNKMLRRGHSNTIEYKDIEAKLRNLDVDEKLHKKLKTGMYNFISKEDFNKMEIGGIKVKDYLRSDTFEGGKDLYDNIINGRKAFTVSNLRYPTESNLNALFSDHTYVYDRTSTLFQNMPEGMVHSLSFMRDAKADNDGDNAYRTLLNILNIDEFDRLQKDVKNRKTTQFALAEQYQKFLFETGNSFEAREKMHSWAKNRIDQAVKLDKFKHSDILGGYAHNTVENAIERSESFLKDFGKKIGRVKIEDFEEFTLEDLTVADRQKIGNLEFVDSTTKNLSKLIKGQTFQQFTNEQQTRWALRVAGDTGIGIAYGASARYKLKLNMIMDRLKYVSNDESLSKNLFSALKLAPGDIPGEITNLKVKKLLEVQQQNMDDVYHRMMRMLQEPEQSLISTKKVLGEGQKALENLFTMMNNLNNFKHKIFDNIREPLGITNEMIQQDELVMQFHNLMMDKDPTFAEEYRTKSQMLSHKGLGLMGVMSTSMNNLSYSVMQNITPEQYKHLINITSPDNISSFAAKTSSAWRDTIKQTLATKSSKSLLTMGIGVGLMTFFNPNQMTGGFRDFGIDLGDRPGKKTRSMSGIESINPEPGEDIFTKKWTHMLKDDPVLSDNISKYSNKNYKDLEINKKTYEQPNLKKKYKRNYIDHRVKYSKFYETNDMRRMNVNQK